MVAMRATAEPLSSHQSPLLLAQGDWKQVMSKDGGYSITMPDEPMDDTRPFDIPSGSVDFRINSMTAKGVYYGVGYGDYPSQAIGTKTPKDLLDELRDAALKAFLVKMNAEKDITLNGHPGREVEYENPDGLVGKARVYIVGKRMYVVGVVTFKGNKDDWGTASNRFLESFQLSPTTGATATHTTATP